MPNIDAGHYFLTVLLPIKTEPVEIYDGIRTTPMLAIREWLAGLPTAHQSLVCVSSCNSPFARNTRNHFARFAVIEVPAFNGRVQGDTVITKLRKINPVISQPSDHLSTPYLFFSADFSCIHGDESDLDSYLATLWETMRPEIVRIFQYCYAFDTIDTAVAFTAFIRRGQIETTMPFHDYWSAEESQQLPTIATPAVIGPIACIAALAFLACGVIGFMAHSFIAFVLLITLAAASLVFGLYKFIIDRGAKSLPAAFGADLPGVLKALYLQRQFTRFIIDNQSADPVALKTAFAAFLQTHQPNHTAAPTQAPGVVGA